MDEFKNRDFQSRELTKRSQIGWWIIVVVGVSALWAPRWIEIIVLWFISNALSGIYDLPADYHKRNAIAELFFKLALWIEMCAWLYPHLSHLAVQWHFSSGLFFIVTAIGAILLLVFCFSSARPWIFPPSRTGVVNPQILGVSGGMQQWTAQDWDLEFKHAIDRFQPSPGNKKSERSQDIQRLLDIARRYGFVQKREGESFERLHFVRIEESPNESVSLSSNRLRITDSGLAYVNSSAFVLEMVGMVAQFRVPDKSFYELLLSITAMHLSESAPAAVGAASFKAFIEDNLPAIRTALNRVKESQPSIGLSEEDWDRTRQKETHTSISS